MTDTKRLDFIIENEAFLSHNNRGWQLMTQGDDEDTYYLSGDDKAFVSPRDAIDEAINNPSKILVE